MGAYAAAGKSPPWTEADESVRSVSVSDVSRMKESEFVIGMSPVVNTRSANQGRHRNTSLCRITDSYLSTL